jgi:PAS domain S-box-containing protein
MSDTPADALLPQPALLVDLATLASLSVGGPGRTPQAIVEALAATILDTLHLDGVCVFIQGISEAAALKAVHFNPQVNDIETLRSTIDQLLAVYLSQAGDVLSSHPDLPNAPNFHTVAIPLGPQGVLIASAGRPGFPSQTDQLVLNVAANQALLLSQQARLSAERDQAEAERHQQAEMLTTLNRLGQVFAAELNLEKLVQAVTDASTQLTGAEFGAFFYNILDAKGESYTLYTLSGVPRSAFEKFPMPRNTPVFGPTFHGEGVVRSANIREDPRYGQLDPYHGMPPGHLPVTSYLAVPVISRTGNVLGGLFFGHSLPAQFSQNAEELLVGLAAQAAIAIDNARLYRTELEARESLEARLEAHSTESRQGAHVHELLVNSVQDYAIFMLNPSGIIVGWNPGAERIKGYKASEIIGQHFSRFYTPQDVQQGRPENGLRVAAQMGRYETEGWRVRKDGSWFWANVVISAVYENQQLVGYAKVTRDLTERRQAEEQMRQSERRLAEAQHIARLGSWHWDLATNLVSLSAELYRIHGLEPRSLPMSYESFLTLINPQDGGLVNQIIQQGLPTHQPLDFDYRIVRADGSLRILQARAEFIVAEQGHVIALAGTSQDVTEHKAMEEEIKQSREQLRQLSAYLEHAREEVQGRIARELHDEIGGLLTGVKMDVAKLQRLLSPVEQKTGQQFETLYQTIDQGVKTVRRIASELRPAILDDLGVLAAMEWQLREFQERSGLKCSWHCRFQDIALSKDAATGLFRVFQESLTNIGRHAQATQVKVTVKAHNYQLLLQIEDNGVGILPQQLRNRGSFGLVGMRERIELLGGTLDIQGQPEHGTTIQVSIPLTTEP